MQAQNYKFEPINPKDFVKYQQKLQQFTCGICFDICIQPFECSGPCKRNFCKNCVSKWKYKNDSCPQKCSSPFLVKPCSQLQILFYCPYNLEKCKTNIKTLKQFNQHLKLCSQITDYVANEFRFKQEYKCKKGHKLQFFKGTYNQITHSLCKNCYQQNTTTRSICRKCDQLYCTKCRSIQVTKQGCMIGHQFQYFSSIGNVDYVCDYCGLSLVNQKRGIYQDNKCNIGICDDCFKQLPQKKEKTFNLKNNDPNFCENDHPLHIQQSNDLKQKFDLCYICEKQKVCPKKCVKCNTKYCIKCKPIAVSISIQLIVKCENNHKFKPQQSIDNIKCFRCNVKESKFEDTQCGILLCESCLYYFVQFTDYMSNNRTSLKDKCIYGHYLLKFQKLFQESQSQQCALCKKKKVMYLKCLYCQQIPRYCSKCVKPEYKKCHMGHQLKQLNEQKWICAICDQNNEENNINLNQNKIFFGCQECNIHICEKCQNDLKQQKNQ